MENNDIIEELEDTSNSNQEAISDNTRNMPQIIDSELISETLEMFDEEDSELNTDNNIDNKDEYSLDSNIEDVLEPIPENYNNDIVEQTNDANTIADIPNTAEVPSEYLEQSDDLVDVNINNENNIEINNSVQNINDINTNYANPTIPETLSYPDTPIENNENLPFESNDYITNEPTNVTNQENQIFENNEIQIPSINENYNIPETPIEVNTMESSTNSENSISNNLNGIPYENNSATSIPLINSSETSIENQQDTIYTVPTNNGFVIPSTIEKDSTSISSSNTSKNTNDNHHKYVGYEVRIGTKLLLAIIMFVIAFVFLIKCIESSKNNITYDERSSIDYSVCLNPNDHYKEECLGMGMEYLSSITRSIPVTFNYNAVYTSKVNHNYKYSIKSTIKVFKPEAEDKVLYTSNETLLKEKTFKSNSNVVSITENVEIPFSKYNDYVTEYNNNYSLDSDSYAEIVLYLQDGDSKKSVGKVVVPLSTQTFNITKDEINNNNIISTTAKNHWKDGTIPYAIISCIFSLIGIIIIVRLIIFILKSINKKSEYEKKLEQILREYDRIIVQIKDKEYPATTKRTIKVATFLELLDARDTLEKPIVHVRVNNIKSEFYVEDFDKVYKYTMKESDFDKK